MKTVIITEAKKDTGLGHLIRCLALYQAFEEKNIHVLLLVNGDESSHKFLSNNINYLIVDWLNQTKEIGELLKEYQIGIIDSYLAQKHHYQKFHSLIPLLVYVDDNNRLEYPPGIILNGLIYAHKMNYRQVNNEPNLLGPNYILLRKEFWNMMPISIKPEVNSIMITTGGSDGRNLVPDLLNTVNKVYPNCKKKVIIGTGFTNIEEIEKACDSNTTLLMSPDVNQIIKLMRNSDLSLTSCGQTLYELVAIGVPTIAFLTADNQENNAIEWSRIGFIKYGGKWDDPALFDNIQKFLIYSRDLEVRKQMQSSGLKKIDPAGCLRVVEFLIKKFQK